MSINSIITVVIPVKDAEDKIEKCLEAVSNQTITPLEIILVDGHSNDNTVAKAQKFNVKIVYEEYGTVGGARKTGVENANGQYIAFTDSDCIPKEDWLENLVNEFEETIVGVGGATENLGKGIWKESISLILNSFLGSANSVQDRAFSTKKYVKSISGCNSMYRLTDLLKVGNFNPTLRMNEDTEINKRLLSIGKILYTPNAVVFHNQDRGLKDFARRMYTFGKGRAQNKLLDLQVVPPFLALLTLLFLFSSTEAFVFMISLYICILIIFDFMLFMSHKKILYLLSIPLVFTLEHVSYTLGFWNGIAKVLSGGLR